MSRWKAVVLRLLKPPLFWLMLLTLFCVPALCALFYRALEQSPLAYPIYVLSAYMFTVWAIRVPPVVKGAQADVYRHPLGGRYMGDLGFRGRLSLRVLCYALFKLGAGVYYRSLWFGAVAVYYICLTLIRGLLLRSIRQKDTNQTWEYRTVRLCGNLLFLLTLALSAMTVQMVAYGKGYGYPGSLIFVAALYTLYSITMSIINLVCFRKLNSPVLSVSKVLGLASALVSMLSLQTAMFASFGGDPRFQRRMNALTGGEVCLLILLVAIWMISRANRAMVRLEIHKP